MGVGVMGWGKKTARPATDAEKLATYRTLAQNDIDLLNTQVSELVEALLVKYLENPDRATRKLLIMHLGAEFFECVDDKSTGALKP